MKHELIIISLTDVQLECSCDKWYMCRTGEMTKHEAIEEHNKHIESEKKYGNQNLQQNIQSQTKNNLP